MTMKPLIVRIDLRRLSEPTLRLLEADLLRCGDTERIWTVSEAIEAVPKRGVRRAPLRVF
jgi:hypothetical protein